MQSQTQILLNSVTSTESPSCLPITMDKLSQQQEGIIEKVLSKIYEASKPEKHLSKLEECKKDSPAHEVLNEERVKIRSDKYPIALKHDNMMGRCLVAARDIEPEEVFLNDFPIVTAPNADGESGITCLGCCLVVTQAEPCGRCGWKVCSEECSNIPQHADFECKIFAKENIKPDLPSPYSFIEPAEYIKILRCLLLKDETSAEKMKKWKQILSLEPNMEIRRNIPRVQLMSGLVKQFVRSLCKLTQYDEATIDFVLGVVDVNAFRHSFAPVPLKQSPVDSQIKEEPIRNATFLYPQASMAAHGCIRNTDWKTLSGGQLEMRASHKIFQGELICHAYVDLMLGTPQRRRLLRNLFYFDCTCERCADPTELGTYFSALKCTLCKSGFLLPENPLLYKSNWVCNNNTTCHETKSYKYEREIVQQIAIEEKQVSEQIPVNSNLITIRSYMKVLKKYRTLLHENHYTLVNIEQILLRHLFKIPNPAKEIKLEMKRLLKKYIKLQSIFHPSVETNP